MRRRAKYSLIIVVVLIAILGLGFGVYKDEILGRYAFYKGEKYFEAEKYEKATRYLKSSLRFNPDNPRTHLLLMKTYWARGLWEEMKEERDKIIALGEEAPPIPLVMKDLENISIDITDATSWNNGTIDVCGGPEDSFGIYDIGREYEDLQAYTATYCVKIACYDDNDQAFIRAGDAITLTYDGEQIITVYLPELIGETDSLYVASDGSIYYDERLTRLAQRVLER